jgi:hypothetical protein
MFKFIIQISMFRSVPCLVPVSFRAVSNALTMSCRAVLNFLKAGHDTVKTRARNSTILIPVPCLNAFRFQPCSYRSVPFPATTCLNLEHYSRVRVGSGSVCGQSARPPRRRVTLFIVLAFFTNSNEMNGMTVNKSKLS